MKKKCKMRDFFMQKSLLKILLIMKFTVFFLLIFVMQLSASVYSQQTKLKVDFNQATIKEVIDEIEKQTDLTFFFSGDVLNISQLITLKSKSMSIDDILDLVSEQTGLSLTVVRDQILVKNVTQLIATGQQNVISGTVTDSKGQPIPGATVVVKGTMQGTVTDSNGHYFLFDISANAILQFSFVGMRTQELAVAGKTVIDIILEEEVVGVDEVVVVGYGTQKKVNLTGAVASVDLTKIAETRPITSVSSGLAGLVPGLYVKSSNNSPGSEASILIRGQGTLNNSAPLVIIDGAEADFSSVSPHDIASISVLKDAASAAVYGSRAANGVILITTKQGEKGETIIHYNGYASFQSVANKMSFVSSNANYMELQNEAMSHSNQTPQFSDENIAEWRAHDGENSLLWPATDWMDAAFRSVWTMNHNVSVSGGTDQLKSFASMNIQDTPGIVENTGSKRITMRMNNLFEVNSWLKVGVNLSGLVTKKDPGANSDVINDFFNATNTIPSIVIKSPDGRFGGTNNSEENLGGCLSPLAYLYKNKGENIARGVNSKFFATMVPVKNLTINGSYHYDYWDNKITSIPQQVSGWNFQTNTITYTSSLPSLSVKNYDVRSVRNFMDVSAVFENSILGKLDYKVMIGGSQEQYSSEYFSATKYGLIDNNLTQINAATGSAEASGSLSDWAMHSFFSRINLSWAGRYLFEANYRRDGSSRFLSDKRRGGFPSLSAGWRISEESFMSDLRNSWLDNLKIRASWGSLGNNSVGNYDAISTLASTLYVLNNRPVTGFSPGDIANGNLQWESTYIVNAGVDWGIKNKLSGSLDFYNKLTKNILARLPIPLEVGLVSAPYQNSAKVRNTGFELNLQWKDKIADVNYFVNGNFTYNKNKVVRFKEGEASIDGTKMIKEGYAINTQYVRLVDRIIQTDDDLALVQSIIDNAPEGKNPFPDGVPQLGDLLYKDTNNDKVINDDDRKSVGHGENPRFIYGLSLGAEWSGFDFSCQLDGVAGLNTYYRNGFYTTSLIEPQIINKDIAEGRWYEGRESKASFPRLTTSSNTRNVLNSDFWVKNNSFLKIRNIQLGYSIPYDLISKIKVNRLRVYVSLENYFTFTSFPGLDPEVTNMGYPMMKQAVFGLNLAF